MRREKKGDMQQMRIILRVDGNEVPLETPSVLYLCNSVPFPLQGLAKKTREEFGEDLKHIKDERIAIFR